MIPKQLFFIWFGDNKPNYVDFAIKAFKEVNSDFKIDLIYMSESEIDNSKDNIIIKLLNEIDNNNYISYPAFKKAHRQYKSRYFKLADLYRWELINKYGGIYLDCDTFPCKPFDEQLLQSESFCAYSYWRDNIDYKKRDPDNFFIGNIKNKKCTRYGDMIFKINVQDPFYLNDKKWLIKKEKFYNLQLKVNECDNKYYIEHFVNRSWLN